jgi:hypothetical protein
VSARRQAPRPKYRVGDAIPTIGARQGDVLVWEYPKVYLVRDGINEHGGTDEAVIKIDVPAEVWRDVLESMAALLEPYGDDTPAVAALLDSLTTSEDLPREVTAALSEMWTKPRRAPKEPSGAGLLHQLCLRESGGDGPPRGMMFPRVKAFDYGRMDYREKNGFPAAEDACTKCGRTFSRPYKNISRCPDCRAGKKMPPIWGSLRAPSRKKAKRPSRPSRVSAPVQASSDDAAVFELLAQIGCRMPEGGAQ